MEGQIYTILNEYSDAELSNNKKLLSCNFLLSKIQMLASLLKVESMSFQYCEEINDALEAGFRPLVSFKNLAQVYKCKELCVINEQQKLLGYVPRCYSKAFARLMEEKRVIDCHVVSFCMKKCCDLCIGVVVIF